MPYIHDMSMTQNQRKEKAFIFNNEKRGWVHPYHYSIKKKEVPPFHKALNEKRKFQAWKCTIIASKSAIEKNQNPTLAKLRRISVKNLSNDSAARKILAFQNSPSSL